MTASWIVGVDGSAASQHAVDWAAAQTAERDVQLRLVSAWEVPLLARLSGIRMASGVDRAGLEATAAHELDVVRDRLEKGGVAVDTSVVEGDAREALLEQSTDAELVVVGQRGHQGLGPIHLGSVSRHCATHCVRPTVVVPEEATPEAVSKVTVGYDGSEEASSAVRWAIDWCRPNVDIEIVHVFEVIDWLDVTATLQRFQSEIGESETAFAEAVRELDPDGRCTSRFEVSDARAVLEEISREVDLLVLGSRGSGRLETVMLGSVANHMLQHASTPTAIVPR